MTSAFTNAIARGFRSLFAPRVTVTKVYSTRTMTAEEVIAFDKAFEAMDAAFDEMNRAIRATNNGKAE